MKVPNIAFGDVQLGVDMRFIESISLACKLVNLIRPFYRETRLGKTQANSSNPSEKATERIWVRMCQLIYLSTKATCYITAWVSGNTHRL